MGGPVAPPFRTFQACLKDLPAAEWQVAGGEDRPRDPIGSGEAMRGRHAAA